MKTLVALFAFSALTENVFAQTPVRLDTLCDKPRKIATHGTLFQYRCKGEDYFMFSTRENDVFLMTSTIGRPRGKCRIKSPKFCDKCLFFRVICDGTEYNYDAIKHHWSVVGDVANPEGSKWNNHDGP